MDIFISNKYKTYYYNIINNAKSQERIKLNHDNSDYIYYENHHIVPKSMGGSNKSCNLVLLTAREHIVAHMILTKCVQDKFIHKAVRAYQCMCVKDNGGKNTRFVSTTHLAYLRQVSSLMKTGSTGIVNVPSWLSNRCNDLDEAVTLIQDHVDSNMSDPKIAKLYNTSATSVFNFRNKVKIKNRRGYLRNKKWLLKMYVENNMTSQEIGTMIGCTDVAVRQYLKKFNIDIRPGGKIKGKVY